MTWPRLSTDIFEGTHIDLNFHGLAGTAQRDAFDGSDVAIVSAPRQGDVTVGNHQVVRWIETEPAATGNEDRNPRVRRLSALDFRTGTHVPTDVSNRQP